MVYKTEKKKKQNRLVCAYIHLQAKYGIKKNIADNDKNKKRQQIQLQALRKSKREKSLYMSRMFQVNADFDGFYGPRQPQNWWRG